MTKRLSVFELQNGKEYAAFDGDRKLDKSYALIGGKLVNRATGEDPGTFNGCDWVPLSSTITFEEIGTVEGVSHTKEFLDTEPRSIMFTKEDTPYIVKDSYGFREYRVPVIRRGHNLYFATDDGIVGEEIPLKRFGLDYTFTPVL